MSIYNLTNQPISSSFQPLLQIDSGSAVRDGSGSLVDNLIVTASFALTASFAENAGEVQTGSLLTTASFDDGTRDLTFTKGDTSTFSVNIPGGSIDTGSLATTGSNTFIGNQVITGSLELYQNNSNTEGIKFITSSGEFIQLAFTTVSNAAPDAFSIINDNFGRILDINKDNGVFEFNTLANFNNNLVSRGLTEIRNLTQQETFTASLERVEISKVAQFAPQNPLPTGALGELTVSGSELYFNDGTNWLEISEEFNTSSFATTGSNNFFGNQTISGSVESTINLSNTHLNPQSITDNVTIPTGLNGLIIGETTIVGDYTIEGNSEVYVFTPPALLDTGSFATTGSNEFIGDQTITGSLNVKEIINLEPQSTLPTGSLGDLAVSGSELYFNDGVNWREVNLT